MGRPREFEMDAALQGAMDVFWTHGFEGASLPLLLAGMDLTRGSFYKAFGDKKSLFLTIMARYETAAVTPAVDLLSDPAGPSGEARVRQVFQGVVATVEGGDARGCLLCSTAAGSAVEDADIAEITTRLLDEMRCGFQTAMETSKVTDAAAMADLLLTQYIGLRILARTPGALPTMERSVAALDQLIAGDGLGHG